MMGELLQHDASLPCSHVRRSKTEDDCKLGLLGRQEPCGFSLWKIERQLQKLYWSMYYICKEMHGKSLARR